MDAFRKVKRSLGVGLGDAQSYEFGAQNPAPNAEFNANRQGNKSDWRFGARIKGVILLVLVVVGLGFFFVDRISSRYALATVNGQEISYADWQIFRDAFESYRATLSKQGGNTEASKALEQLSAGDIDRMTLEQMIGQVILHEHLTQEFGLRAEDMVRSGLKKARATSGDSAERSDAPLSTFEQLVLVPQIERAVASELVRSNGGDFSKWTLGHLAEATVSVRWYTYKWENGTLKKK